LVTKICIYSYELERNESYGLELSLWHKTQIVLSLQPGVLDLWIKIDPDKDIDILIKRRYMQRYRD